MIVEDDNDIRELLRDLLEGEGYEVDTACNGREGLEKLEKAKADLILLDLMMPVLDGCGFLDEYKGEAPVIVVTASGSQTGPPEGATSLLRKPLQIDDLLQAIKISC